MLEETASEVSSASSPKRTPAFAPPGVRTRARVATSTAHTPRPSTNASEASSASFSEKTRALPLARIASLARIAFCRLRVFNRSSASRSDSDINAFSSSEDTGNPKPKTRALRSAKFTPSASATAAFARDAASATSADAVDADRRRVVFGISRVS